MNRVEHMALRNVGKRFSIWYLGVIIDVVLSMGSVLMAGGTRDAFPLLSKPGSNPGNREEGHYINRYPSL